MRRAALAALVLAALATAALVFYVYNRGATGREAAARSRVVVQLQWLPGAQFLGFYTAKAKNYYAEEGLAVEFLHGGPEVNPIESLKNKRASVALATADQVLLTAASGNLHLKAVGTVFSESLARFMSRPDNPVNTPADFRGKSVGVFPSYDTDNLLRALLVRYGIDVNTVTVVNFPNLVNFQQRELDAYGSYITNEPIWAERRHLQPVLLDPAEFGITFYSDTIITTSEYYRTNSDELTRFVRASARGWQFAQKQTNEAIDLMWQEIGSLTGPGEAWEHQRESARRTVQYVGKGGPHKHTFEMERGRWENMEAALRSIERLPARIVNTGQGTQSVLIDELCDFDFVDRALPQK